ncbi:hypothetical protein ABPG75_004578 [Micractinium tetrahymenae]
MASRPVASVLLLALLAASWVGPEPAAARRLVQAPTDGPPVAGSSVGGGTSISAAETALSPGPESPYGGPRIDACVKLTNYAGQACSVESDTSALVYPRGSEELPTQQEIDTAIQNMKAAAQPSASCCDALLPYVQSRCPCDLDYQQLLPIGGFSPAYFEGATAILAQACGQSFPPCAPGGEISKPVLPPGAGRK